LGQLKGKALEIKGTKMLIAAQQDRTTKGGGFGKY
jgi:hypothetical protein